MVEATAKVNNRLSIRISRDEKDLLIRAAALMHTDVTTFVLQTVLPAAESVIEDRERFHLDKMERRRLFELLESPPEPNEHLIEAARTLRSSRIDD